MLIFLYGQDAYRLRENAAVFVSAYQKKFQSGFNRHDVDLAKAGPSLEGPTGFDELAGTIKSVSFFNETKFIYIRNAFSSSEKHKAILDLIDRFKLKDAEDMVLLFVADGGAAALEKSGRELFGFLAKNGKLVREFEPLAGESLESWIRGKFKGLGASIHPDVPRLLVAAYGNDSWVLANEIEKLANYRFGSMVLAGDVDLFRSNKETDSIFSLLDAIGSKDRTRAFELLYRLIQSGQEENSILSMMVWHFENLLTVADAVERGLPPQTIAKTAGISPFVVKKALRQIQLFSKEELIARFNQLADLDVSFKSGAANLSDALFDLILN